MSSPLCLLDMDGVIADFVGGACLAHMRCSPYTDPELGAKALGVFELEKPWGISTKEFWEPCRGFRFWSSLSKTPEADYIVALLTGVFGVENIAILTAPSQDDECIPAKIYWIRSHFPQLESRMMTARDKRFCAGPGHILVDDRDKNIKDFNLAGGHGILIPRLWNSSHSDSNRVLETLEHHLGEIE